jgi:hypothetical protein
MVLISHGKKFIFIKNKKCAGTSVEAFFEKYCMDPSENYVQSHFRDSQINNFGIISQRADPYNFKGHDQLKWRNHMGIKEIIKHLGKKKAEEYFKFCVIRNPYDKMVSFYHHRMRVLDKTLTFDEWCKYRQTHCLNNYRLKLDDEYKIDFYIRYEHLEDDIKKVCEKLNIDFNPNNLPKYKNNIRPKKPYQKYYNNERTKNIVYMKHQKEFEKYNYKF